MGATQHKRTEEARTHSQEKSQRKKEHGNRQENRKDTLIALLKYKRDLGIAQQQRWYRIPVKAAPTMVKKNTIKYLALYQPKVFQEEAFQIRWYGEVKQISRVKRQELLPHEKSHPQAQNDYYKIEINELRTRPHPIISRRPRRMLFITTTFSRFQQARELNDVFYESPLEERVWNALQHEGIEAERQYGVHISKKTFYLDFAIFSQARNIDVECDGDRYHTDTPDVKRDKWRNNLLESQGWAVLRYTTDDINNHLEDCISQVKETVNQYGGVQDSTHPSVYRYIPDETQPQLDFFTI